MTKILLIEDDISLIDGLKYSLRKNNFEIETIRTVDGALHQLNTIDQINQYNLLLLDVTLPDGTGFDVCEQVRKLDNQIPIIFLTASDEEVNVIRGLDSGGDDYITKPFRLGELCSRIRALLRRSVLNNPTAAQGIPPEGAGNNSSISGCLVIDFKASRVTLNGEPLELTLAEYRLLSLLVQNAGGIVSRETILTKLWDNMGNFVDDNTLSVYIRRLREKIEDNPSQPKHLVTVRGYGYRWVENVEENNG